MNNCNDYDRGIAKIQNGRKSDKIVKTAKGAKSACGSELSRNGGDSDDVRRFSPRSVLTCAVHELREKCLALVGSRTLASDQSTPSGG